MAGEAAVTTLLRDPKKGRFMKSLVDNDEEDDATATLAKRGPGRPHKKPEKNKYDEPARSLAKKGRGRPRKQTLNSEDGIFEPSDKEEEKPKRKRAAGIKSKQTTVADEEGEEYAEEKPKPKKKTTALKAKMGLIVDTENEAELSGYEPAKFAKKGGKAKSKRKKMTTTKTKGQKGTSIKVPSIKISESEDESSGALVEDTAKGKQKKKEPPFNVQNEKATPKSQINKISASNANTKTLSVDEAEEDNAGGSPSMNTRSSSASLLPVSQTATNPVANATRSKSSSTVSKSHTSRNQDGVSRQTERARSNAPSNQKIAKILASSPPAKKSQGPTDQADNGESDEIASPFVPSIFR